MNKIFGIIVFFIAEILVKINFFNLRENWEQICKIDPNGCKIPNRYFHYYLIISEDKRFYFHYGFDIYAIFRAVFHFVFQNKIEGASTIEQQFVRTVTNERERSIRRKLKEIFLSSLLKKNYSKDDIINSYLSIAFFGDNLIGLNKVACLYNKKLYELTNKEIAEIISRLKYPQFHNINEQRIMIRSGYILNKYEKESKKYIRITVHNNKYTASGK